LTLDGAPALIAAQRRETPAAPTAASDTAGTGTNTGRSHACRPGASSDQAGIPGRARSPRSAPERPPLFRAAQAGCARAARDDAPGRYRGHRRGLGQGHDRAAYARPLGIWDQNNVLDVLVQSPGLEFETRTELEVLNGANLLLVGQEIIQFADAEQLGPSEWRLSKLLRGRRGTEWAMSMHQVGEFVLVLDPAALSRVSSLDEVGLARFYRAVSIGSDPSLGVFDQPGLQWRHRADRGLRRVLDSGHDPPVERRSVRLPAPMERGARAHGQSATRHAPLDPHRRDRLSDGAVPDKPALRAH
jgi:hypothetical protein